MTEQGLLQEIKIRFKGLWTFLDFLKSSITLYFFHKLYKFKI